MDHGRAWKGVGVKSAEGQEGERGGLKEWQGKGKEETGGGRGV